MAALTCLAILSCRETGDDQQANAGLENATSVRALPVAEPPLERSALLIATMRAASARAAGRDDSDEQSELDGKRFELRLRFGCASDNPDDPARGWRFDEAQRTLRLRVTNDISAAEIEAAGVAVDDFESVEGLWLRRPWLLQPACPRNDQSEDAAETESKVPLSDSELRDSASAVVVSRRVGVAQFYTSTDARTARRKQRPYEVTKVLDEGAVPSEQGYDFVMSGRLRALPDRRVIACWSARIDGAPDCIISVHIDRAWIERPDNHEMLAEWR